jgi:hypothetical protein
VRLQRLQWFEQECGGPARLRVIATLATVPGLDSSDTGMIGATATDLQQPFSLGTNEIGLLLTVSSLVALVALVATIRSASSSIACR